MRPNIPYIGGTDVEEGSAVDGDVPALEGLSRGPSRARSGQLRGAAASARRCGGGARRPLHVTGDGWTPEPRGVEAAGIADAETSRRSSPTDRGDRTSEHRESSWN